MMKLHVLNLFLENFKIIDRNLVSSSFGEGVGVGCAKVPNAPGSPHY